MEIIICHKCKNILLAIDGLLSVDIPLPGSAIESKIKCKCGQVSTLNIINRLQGSRYDWPTEERFLIDWNEVKFEPRDRSNQANSADS